MGKGNGKVGGLGLAFKSFPSLGDMGKEPSEESTYTLPYGGYPGTPLLGSFLPSPKMGERKEGNGSF